MSEMTVIEVTEEESRRLNTAISELDELGDGKIIHYLGWWWRAVDWARPIQVSFTEGHAWIDEAGKWDYPTRVLSDSEAARLVGLVIELADTRTVDAAAAVNGFLESVAMRLPTPPETLRRS